MKNRRQFPLLDESIGFGLCTYMWGAEWDLDAIIANCRSVGVRGVELRVEHAHKVTPELSEPQRAAVRDKFADSGVEIIGMGTNAQFDAPDKAALGKNLDLAKQYVRLSHDIGGSGVKVKPNNFHDKQGISREQTLEQIGKSLAELGGFSAGFGQEIRLEVHGDVTDLADIKKTMDIANEENVRVCWNSNPTDLAHGGIDANFSLVKDKLGHTTHIHEINSGKYPYDKLAKLLVEAAYTGWVLMEAASKVTDKVAALGEQKALWETLVTEERKK